VRSQSNNNDNNCANNITGDSQPAETLIKAGAIVKIWQ